MRYMKKIKQVGVRKSLLLAGLILVSVSAQASVTPSTTFRFDQTSLASGKVEIALAVNDAAAVYSLIFDNYGVTEISLSQVGAAITFSNAWSYPPNTPLVAGSVQVGSALDYLYLVTDPHAFGVQYSYQNPGDAPNLVDGAKLFSFVIDRPVSQFGSVDLDSISLGGYELRQADFGTLAQTTISTVPEPGMYAFMLSGILLIGARVRRSRNLALR